MKRRRLNTPQAAQVQKLLFELQEHWHAEEIGHDTWIAMGWLDDAVDEAFLHFPRVFHLRIFMHEVEKRAPRSREIRDRIDIILSLLVD